MNEGDLIQLLYNDKIVEGFVVKDSKDSLVLKLKNGYNIGIEKKNAKNIKIISKSTKSEKPKFKEQKHNNNLKTIMILHCGGTIASKVDYRTGGVVSRFNPEEILDMFPELNKIANIESEFIANMWSDDLRFEHFSLIAKSVEKQIKKGVDGIIIGMGTDNLAVASAAMSFILEKIPIPVIFVGAQRSSDRGSSDAGMNLLCAAEFIAKTDFAGVALCMHSSSSDNSCFILPACKTAKLHSSRRDAFKVVNDTAIAKVNYKSNQIEFIKKDYTKRNNEKVVIKPKLENKIGLLKIHINMSPEQFKFFKNYKGLIIEGTGLGHTPGHVPNPEAAINKKIFPAIKEVIDSGCIVVMTTQCLFGRVNMNVYDKGRDLINLGVIPGEDMLANTAFVKLAWLLGNYKKDEVKYMLNDNLRGEISERTKYEEEFI
ncbi:MAG: Glu-tRNA(Gln) amidotransferase subunit GatD [Candidatus Nanoarchaeia archaeon]|nr:Glu-tRNA(Gln) amidotransferase subunit GatD [Candidatus Nanoarchaeia archaeon]MDD5588090.1 Glu-tRNA(Gln) amidotransferase subunit GatD [Candidatus Nanoarchaeia archaeon]